MVMNSEFETETEIGFVHFLDNLVDSIENKLLIMQGP